METCFEILLWGLLGFIIGMVGAGTPALIGIGIARLVHKARETRERSEK